MLFARHRDLLPGNQPSLRLAIDVASALVGRRDGLVVGPLSPDEIADAGIELPAVVEHRSGPDDMAAFAAEQTREGDVVIVPTRSRDVGSGATDVFRSGRSVLVAAHNPESTPGLSAGTMTLPLDATL